jgi:hypothetical protein
MSIRPVVFLPLVTLLAVALFPGTALSGGGALEGQAPRVSVAHGAEIRILMERGERIQGELLAVERDRLWYLASDESLRSASAPELRRVEIQRHTLGSRRIFVWTAVAGGVTSLGMIGACSSVSDGGDCAGFTVVWALAWAGVGGLAWAAARPTRRVGGDALEELRPWARFPQGLPEGFPEGFPASAGSVP